MKIFKNNLEFLEIIWSHLVRNFGRFKNNEEKEGNYPSFLISLVLF